MQTGTFDFDEVIDRRGKNARKWDAMERLYGVSPADGIPMWVADMEFRPPPAVIEALQRAIGVGVFGYFDDRTRYHEAIIAWMQRHHGWAVEEEWIRTEHGTVMAMHVAVRAFCEPGDGVIIQPPVYYPFGWSVERNAAVIVSNHLVADSDGRAEMDLDHLASVIDSRTKMLMLCSPHNPGGRVWTRSELVGLAELCLRHDIIMVSDEVHHDLVYEPGSHTVLATLDDEVANQSVIFTSASKTFNLAGFMTGNAIIPNEELRDRFVAQQEAAGTYSPNLLGAQVTQAAYTHGDEWLAAALAYLRGNRDLLESHFAAHLPEVVVAPLEGTYLAWIDTTMLDLSADEVIRRIEKVARVAVSHGAAFGPGGENHLRLNFAMARPVLRDALERITSALNA